MSGDNGPVFHSWIVYHPKLTPYSHGADVPFTPVSPSLFLLQMSLAPASLLYTAGLNRSVERARQTNRHATSCVSGAGAASQYAKRINAVRRGGHPPWPCLTTVPLYKFHSKPDAQRRKESPLLQFHNKSRQLLIGQNQRVNKANEKNLKIFFFPFMWFKWKVIKLSN